MLKKIVGMMCVCLLMFVTLAYGGETGTRIPCENAVSLARSKIWQAINSGKCGSAALAIAVDGKVVYSEGFGMADRVRSVPVGPSTLFNIGSISKVYAAAAIMLLVDDGRVSLDAPVTAYIPEFRMSDKRYGEITVRMLLNHSSGIPGTTGSNAFGFRYEGDIKQITLNALSRARLKHAPGAIAVYCNDGFTLAEIIVERVSGKRFIDFLEERIFSPLGLKNTGMGIGELRDKPIALYYDVKSGKPHPPETLSVLGAGGLSSTVEDLCLFMDAFSAEMRLFQKTSFGEMRKAQPPASGGRLRNPGLNFGLGWDLTGLPRYDAAGISVLGKSGGTGNYSSMVYTVPDKRISVALVASGPDSGAIKIALDVLNEVLVEKMLISKEERPVTIPPAAQELPMEQEASFQGYYGSDVRLGQVLFDKEKRVVTLNILKGQEKRPALTLLYNNGYYYDENGDRFYFAGMDGESHLVSLISSIGLDAIVMQKVKPVENPRSLKIDMDGKTWLRRNVSPFESAMAVETHLARSILYKDLPGYVFFGGIKRIDSPDFAGMSFDSVRDQTELALFEKDGAVWAWVSDLLYSPAKTAIPLKEGENSVKIGDDGHNVWIGVLESSVVSFTRPENGRIIVFSPDDTATYDSAIDSGDACVAEGGYIEIAGLPNDVFTIKARK